jgi:hypothetical protein
MFSHDLSRNDPFREFSTNNRYLRKRDARNPSGVDGLCGKTRKMTGRENLYFARRTSSAQVIVTMRRMEGHTWQDRPRGRSPAESSFKAVYGRSNCDRREKSSFSTQST